MSTRVRADRWFVQLCCGRNGAALEGSRFPINPLSIRETVVPRGSLHRQIHGPWLAGLATRQADLVLLARGRIKQEVLRRSANALDRLKLLERSPGKHP